MNKKLLFGIMSLAALTACTNDDFESQKVAQEVSPIQFEVLNNDVMTRASMDGNKIVWNANDGDIFTLYHGGGLGAMTPTNNFPAGGFENAIYTATVNEGAAATLTTPTMIKAGKAVMVWPADTTFRINAGNLSIAIPANQKADIENYIPYMSDLVDIAAYNPAAAAYNTAGYQRKYPVFMRPMASQLIVKADYAGSDSKLAQLYTGADPINPISVSRIDLLTDATGGDKFTTEIGVEFQTINDFETATGLTLQGTPANPGQWLAAAPNNAWTHVTSFDVNTIGANTDKLTTKCLDGNDGCKFLILPQNAIALGVDEGAVVVNTIYGKVLIGDPTVYNTIPNKSYYSVDEYNAAWYRYATTPVAAATAEENASATEATTIDGKAKYKTVAKSVAWGMQQTINGLSTYTHKADGVVKGEPEGAAATRYAVVNLNYLDMSELHINSDKWLRDAARVWKHMDLDDVTVYLDGAANGEFLISQNTIDVINKINADLIAADGPGARQFHVQPCDGAIAGHNACNTIVVTGGGAIRDLRFIEFNDVNDNGAFNPGVDVKADVALNKDETWSWTVDAAGNYIVIAPRLGVNSIINRGTMTFTAGATLQTSEDGYTSTYHPGTAAPNQNNILFVNEGTLNINGGIIYAQMNVTNIGTVNIAAGAQYRQDGRAQSTEFNNEAYTLPYRFTKKAEKIGTIWNRGVFATVTTGTKTAEINNYGVIEHDNVDAKTYITRNQTYAPVYSADASFATAFKHDATGNTSNKMGRINLPFSNKEEDNISISAAANSGFVSVTVEGDIYNGTNKVTKLEQATLGERVNYIIIKNSSIETIGSLKNTAGVEQIKYVEINADKEISWSLPKANPSATYDGLMVLSPVNIKLNTTISIVHSTFLGNDMYVGGEFKHGANDVNDAADAAFWDGYFGPTHGNFATKYITF